MNRSDGRRTLGSLARDSIARTLSDLGLAVPVPEAGGPQLGRFRVRGELGQGGMGRVYLAHDPDLLRDVAIKVLHDDPAADVGADRTTRFVVEGRIASQLDHPNIVPVHELGTTPDGQIFLVMRRVEGQSMADALAALAARSEATVSRERLLIAFVQVCQAVGYAHGRGVVHRDLKPGNIMLGAHGEVLVVDWGIATLQGAPARPVTPGPGTVGGETAIVGTPGYMSPESWLGGDAASDPRRDVFSLGAVLYEILTLEPAFSRLDPYARDAPPDPAAVGALVDEELARICMKALAPAADDRFADGAALARALASWQDGAERRGRAATHVQQARADLSAWVTRRAALEGREAAVLQAGRRVRPWLPLEHPEKAALHEERRWVDAERVALAELFEAIQAGGEAALSLDAGNAAARALLAEAHWMQLEDAERRKDRRDLAYHTKRVRAYDDGTRAALLRGTGALSLTTEPAGALVIARRLDTQGLVWTPSDPVVLGTTPLRDVPLEMGSWQLTLQAPGHCDTCYPVWIRRGTHWRVHADRPLPLLPSGSVPAGWCQVPEGPYTRGGDPDANLAGPATEELLPGFLVQEVPVTAASYARFVEAVHARDPDEAWGRIPRDRHGEGAEGSQLWPAADGGRWRFPLRDKDGDTWQGDWAVCGISWQDAQAYAAWMSTDDVPIRVVSEAEFEKAARGVDARHFPWGDSWDASLCSNLGTHEGQPRPEVVGTHRYDRSPYGVRDLAGGMRTWCRDPEFEGKRGLRPMRGGYWGGSRRMARAANRYGMEPGAVHSYLGIRLTRPLPRRTKNG